MSKYKLRNFLYGSGIIASTGVAGVAIWNLINNQPDWETIEKNKTDTLVNIVETINRDNIKAREEIRKEMNAKSTESAKIFLKAIQAIQQNKPVDNSAKYIEAINKIIENSDKRYEQMIKKVQEINYTQIKNLEKKLSGLENILKNNSRNNTIQKVTLSQGYTSLNLAYKNTYNIKVDRKSCPEFNELSKKISPAILYFLEKHNKEFTLTKSVDKSENFANELYIVDKNKKIVGWLDGENLHDKNKNNDMYNKIGFSSKHSEEAIEFQGYVNNIQLEPRIIKYMAKLEQKRMKDLIEKVNRLNLKDLANGKSTHVSTDPLKRICASFDGYVKEIDANGQAVWYQKSLWSRGVNTVSSGINFIPDSIAYGTESLDDLASDIKDPTVRNLTRIPTVIIDNAIGGTLRTASSIIEYTFSLIGDTPLDSINPKWNYTKITDKKLIEKLEKEYNHVIGFGHNYQSKNIAGSTIKAYYVGKNITPIVLGIVGATKCDSDKTKTYTITKYKKSKPPIGGDITGGDEF